jgi:hypothetical protein
MVRLNRCRLYLQVLTISDITANGKQLLPHAKLGQPIPHRVSTLSWPRQGSPNKADWLLWRDTLQHLEANGVLTTPLGSWINTSHQLWSYHYQQPTGNLYFSQDDIVHYYQPIVSQNARTRSQHRPWYDLHRSIPVRALPTSGLQPAIIEHNYALTGSLFHANTSTDAAPPPQPTIVPVTSPYHSCFDLSTNIPLDDIKAAAEQSKLTVNCYSSFNIITGATTSTWSFWTTALIYESTTEAVLSQSRRRAELTSIMVALEIIRRAAPGSGQININSNHKQAQREAFNNSPVGVCIATQADSDIILEIRRLWQLIPVPISVYYGPSQNAGVPETTPTMLSGQQAFKHFLQQPDAIALQAIQAYTLPSRVITILHKGVVINTHLLQTLRKERHSANLQEKLMKDNKWSKAQFDLVDWESYHKAILTVPRAHRTSIVKLSHQLWNTNHQNSKYYGQDASCHACSNHPETLDHVYTCSHPSVSEPRQEALQQFNQALGKISPSNIAETIIAGLNQWIAYPNNSSYVSPTAGSLLPQLAKITAAFRAQTVLGWNSFL